MTARQSTAAHLAPPGALDQAVPAQSRRRPVLPPADRIVRQARAMDVWLTARREREQALQSGPLSRHERMDVGRELEVLRRIHDAIKDRCARGLDADLDGLQFPAVTAVIAHHHTWFVDELSLLLGSHGVTVLVSTDNGAEALGAVVAEQPDIVLVGGSLAMLHGRSLLVESRLYAPHALLAGQVADPQEADRLRAAADSVFLRHHAPAAVADALVALHLMTTGAPRTSPLEERPLP